MSASPPFDAQPAPPAGEIGSAARAVLAATPWLSAVPGVTLDGLANAAVLHRVPPGSLMFEQGEMPTFALLLTSGSVDLLGVRGSEETPVEFVQAIDFLLLAAVLNRQPYLLRARVLDAALARVRFPHDPLIDGREPITPLPVATLRAGQA